MDMILQVLLSWLLAALVIFIVGKLGLGLTVDGFVPALIAAGRDRHRQRRHHVAARRPQYHNRRRISGRDRQLDRRRSGPVDRRPVCPWHESRGVRRRHYHHDCYRCSRLVCQLGAQSLLAIND